MAPQVLVTGAGGFIGSHLVEHLARAGYRVKALVHQRPDHSRGCLKYLPLDILKSLEVIEGDIQDAEAAKSWISGCDSVIHLAALMPSHTLLKGPRTFIDINVTGTLNILHAALNADTRVLHTSSADVYGPGLYVPIDEKHPLQGRSPYSASKIAADMLVESFHRSFALNTVILRPFFIYGPRQKHLVPEILEEIHQGQRVFSLDSQTPYFNLTYISDLLDAYMAMLKAGDIQGEVIHIGQSQDISYDVLLAMIANHLGISIDFSGQLASGPRQHCQAGKARKLLGWEPQISLESGLEQTLSWFGQFVTY